MTSINAIRFDRYSGAMVCDEQRHWNEERLKLYGADKILPVVPPEILRRTGLAASYGNTGTSAIGDELRLTIRARVQAAYESRRSQEGAHPVDFLDLEEVAELAFGIMAEVKHQHTDDGLRERFGFTSRELIAGRCERDGQEFEVRDPKVVEKAHLEVALPAGQARTSAVYGNAGILAGVDRQEGFRVFLFSMREQYWEQVEHGFICHGSGSDTANFVMGRFYGGLPGRARFGGMDRLEGLMALIGAVDEARRCNMGVGGYPVVTLFDARAEEPDGLQREIHDHRAQLASEAIRARASGMVPSAAAREIVQGILFEDRSLAWGEEILWSAAEDRLALHRLLRDYPVDAT